jgi:acetyl-CoA carboxylase biotin carboxyl carrier protein
VNLTNEDVQEILRLLDASSFDELHLETDRFRLTLRRSGAAGGPWTQETHTLARPRAEAAPTGRSVPADITARAAPDASAAATDGLVAVPAPIIGTFYRAPKPGAAPFVEIGAKVSAETVVGIVETMKLMNSVYAGAAGEIAEICVGNGQLVEQNHVLMRIRPLAP